METQQPAMFQDHAVEVTYDPAATREYPRDWHQHPVLSFDLETTGVDPHTARIVTWAMSLVSPNPGVTPITYHGIVRPEGFEIPEEAAAIHGWTTEKAREHPEATSLYDALARIVELANSAEREGMPIVVYNAPFDITILMRECERIGEPPPRALIQGPIIDPLVIDKWQDKYRKGKRTLGVNCSLYGVELGDDAHSADADAVAAARLAYALHERYEPVRCSLEDLHMLEKFQFAAQAESFEKFLRRKPGNEGKVISRAWPFIPAPMTP